MRIKKLEPFIVSQIAAGEVIERPASVLKELLENSIDAGSNRIDIFIEKGGVKSIRVQDDGDGIYCEDLELALTQHATSKIVMIEDLEGICSLGFRGEALASVASVSELELISKPKSQETAWKISTNQLTPMPIAHSNGTTVIVQNLFYNIPVRRKFLRSENTEFRHLEEVFKRIALSNFSVALSLTHNGKELRKLPICFNEETKNKRLSKIFGEQTVKHSIYIDVEQNNLRLYGWLELPEYAKAQAEHQYFYINNRIIKDRLINHALRQTYQNCYDLGKNPNYCLYLDLDFKSLDVNVHPTKHEVRFHNARVIHAFISKVIDNTLNQYNKTINTCMFEKHVGKKNILAQAQEIDILTVINNKLILAKDNIDFILVDIVAAERKIIYHKFMQLFLDYKDIPAKPLLIPRIIKLDDHCDIMEHEQLFITLGFQLDQSGIDELLLRDVPQILSSININYEKLINALLKLFNKIAKPKFINTDIMTCLELIISCVETPEVFSDQLALQLMQKLQQLPKMSNYKFKSAYRRFQLSDLIDFINHKSLI